MSTSKTSASGPGSPLAIMAALPTATIYEAAGKWGDVGPPIRLLVDGVRLAGPAFTVKAMPGDNLVVFRAIDEAPPGSVIVLDAGATDRATIWGGTSTTACVAKKIAGCVTNAAVRDMAQIRALRFPIYAAGVNVRGTVKSHPGWTQVPISIADVPVKPGDLVFGDEDGVVIVQAERAAEVAEKAVAKAHLDAEREERLRRGETFKQVLGY
ncbi:MAG TPA: RraA family protein [Alphaproteobacteria bacterium]|nr:RraA family protein [Alphaproteobacteria bacterium]